MSSEGFEVMSISFNHNTDRIIILCYNDVMYKNFVYEHWKEGMYEECGIVDKTEIDVSKFIEFIIETQYKYEEFFNIFYNFTNENTRNNDVELLRLHGWLKDDERKDKEIALKLFKEYPDDLQEFFDCHTNLKLLVASLNNPEDHIIKD